MIPSASGYPQLTNVFTDPVYVDKFLDLTYCATIYPNISETRAELSTCGTQAIFRKEPDVEIRPYVKNQQLEHTTPDTSTVTMNIDQSYYFSVKMDDVDMKQICNSSQLQDVIFRRAAYKIGVTIDEQVMGTQFTEAAPENQGTEAGVRSRAYNLGETGNPFPLDSENILAFLLSMKMVLKEACIPEDDLFVIVPPRIELLLMTSELANCFTTCTTWSPLIEGYTPPKVAGFEVYVSNHVPTVVDSGVNDQAWWIIAGSKSATGFTAQLDKTRDATSADYFGVLFQGLALWGTKVLYPERLAVGYVTAN